MYADVKILNEASIQVTYKKDDILVFLASLWY
jgi:hypothetical protein